jgi:superfamily II DNA or RNA helicase
MAEPRTLRSKHARNALWIAADGRCQRCEQPLGDDWQADHRIPWSATRRTNVNEMQALCAACNRRKGAMAYRSHQAAMDQLAQRIAGRLAPLPSRIGVQCVCGGGKSALVAICAHHLIRAGVIDKLCWVTPRGSLSDQALESFAADDWTARLLGHALKVYSSTNTPNPSKGGAGYVTTYQAIAADGSGINRREFERCRYGLFLDEPHHVRVGSPWERPLAELVDRAALVVLMTGTLDRHDRKPVYLFPYTTRGFVDTRYTDEFPWIRYTLWEATAERALIRVHVFFHDGRAEWREDGVPKSAETLADDSAALFAALHSEYARHLLGRAVADWRRCRERQARSKLLVVCATIGQARLMLRELKRLGIERADIATSADDDPKGVIKRFRGKQSPELDALVTVAMAYEGLDAPSITHLVCLTHIRSRPWIEQMVGRAWRYDAAGGPWESQTARIFAPDDALMREVLEAIEAGQVEALGREAGDPRAGGVEAPEAQPVISPEGSELTLQRIEELGGERATVDETRRYAEIAGRAGLDYLTPIEVKRLLAAAAAIPAAAVAGMARCGRGVRRRSWSTSGRTWTTSSAPQGGEWGGGTNAWPWSTSSS